MLHNAPLPFDLAAVQRTKLTIDLEDGNDLDHLRHDPLLKLAVGRARESGAPLASQSTISRLENAPRKTDAARLAGALVDQFRAHVTPGAEEILDIDDTFCAASRFCVDVESIFK